MRRFHPPNPPTDTGRGLRGVGNRDACGSGEATRSPGGVRLTETDGRCWIAWGVENVVFISVSRRLARSGMDVVIERNRAVSGILPNARNPRPSARRPNPW